MQNGTVEDSLRSRIPVPGKQPHRLDWNSRAKVALTTAQGLLGLRQEGLQHRPAALLPNKVYLGSLGQAKILPPSISSLVTGQEVKICVLPAILSKKYESSFFISILR